MQQSKRKASDDAPDMAERHSPSVRAGQRGLADKAGMVTPARETKRKAERKAPAMAAPGLPSVRAGHWTDAGKAMAAMPARIKSGAKIVAPETAESSPLPVDSGAAHATFAEKANFAVAAPLLDQLAELQVRRKFYIATTNKQMNAGKALMRRYLGWRHDADDATRDKVNAAASQIVAAAFSGKGEDVPPDLLVLRAAVQPLNAARDGVEKDMKRLARMMPVYPWAKSVAGFGELGLAVFAGEAGDLSSYPAKGHLWKQFGLAPFEGKAYSSWRSEGGLSAEQWTEAGYSPRRRAEIFAVVAEPLFRHQSMTAGPYRAVYDRRRAATAETHPDWTKGHSHADGLRVMTKIFLRDLWAAYRRAGHLLPGRAGDDVPADPIRKRRAEEVTPERDRAEVPGARRAAEQTPERARATAPAEPLTEGV